jgi:ribosomal protein S6--L-glutamate ligase
MMRIGIMSASLRGPELRENQRLIDEITSQGHEAVLINYRRCATAVTEEGRTLYQYDDNDRLRPIEIDAVIPRIGKYVEDGTLVLGLLASQGVYSTVLPTSVMIAKNKMYTHILLDSNGIPTPYSISPTGPKPENPTETLKVIEPDHTQRLIVKTLRGSHGKGVMPAYRRSQAKAQVETLQANRVKYLVQEFAEAPEPDQLASDVRLVVVEGLAVAAMKRRARNKEEFRSNLAQGAEGIVYEPTPRETELAVRACAMLDIGVGGVDIIPSKRGPLVNEVNVSPEFGIEQVSGVNIAGLIADLAVRNAEKRAMPQAQPLASVANEDIRSA